MGEKSNNNLFSHLGNDFPASIVVFLVAVPLCLGIALASGAPLFSGIIAGIVGGIVVGIFSKSSLGVSGPAAGLAVIVLTSIEELGSFEIFLFATIIAGVFQIILGILKAGVIAYYFPSSVIKGMLSGIGIIIILKQIPHAFGYDKDPEGDFRFFQTDGHNTFSELGYMLDAITPAALVISIISVGILILWEQGFMKKLTFTKIIQGPLVVVLGGIGYSMFLGTHASYGLSADHLVRIPVSSDLGGFVSQFTSPDFSAWKIPAVWTIGLTIAVVASLETLLCVEATDKLDPEKKVTPTNRELTAQGIGNIVSGFIGGLPITQVIVRSSANIQSGGKTKMSAIFHGIFLLIAAAVIPKFLNYIPLASLAAILFIVGYKLAKPSIFKEMRLLGRDQFIPFVTTILGIVFTDLLTGIAIGLVVAIFFILWKNYQAPYEFDASSYEKGAPIKVKLASDLTFIHKARIIHTLEELPEDSELILDASNTIFIHPDILEILENFKITAKRKNISYRLEGWHGAKIEKDVVKKLGNVINQRT